MSTAAPGSPGTAPPADQPAVMPFSAGGTSTVPSALSPSRINSLVTPIEGMVTWAGAGAFGRSAGSVAPSADESDTRAVAGGSAAPDDEQPVSGTRNRVE